MDGKIFPSNLMNVAQQRDFYRLQDMSDADIEQVREILINPMSRPEMKALAYGLLAIFDQARQIKKECVRMGLDASDELEELYLGAEEHFHGMIEQGAVPLLNRLLTAESFSMDDEVEYHRFAHFAMTQYFRTSRMRENVRRGLGINFSRIEPSLGAIRHIMAMAAALTLLDSRDVMKPCLLINESEVPLITGDQPAINTHAVYLKESEAVSEMELYYPISPTRAVLISSSDRFGRRTMDAALARDFNEMMALSAERQIFGAKMSDLTEWKAVVGSVRTNLPEVSA